MRKAITGLAVVALVAGVALVAISLSEAPSALAQDAEEQIFNGPLDEVLDGLVEDGVITGDQRDKIGAAFDEHLVRFGKGYHGTPHLETVAEVLNMDVDDLAAQLKDGASVADIAGEAKVQTVVDALVAEHEDRIDEAVGDGRLSEEDGEEVRAAVAERVEAMVNGKHPAGIAPFGMDRFHGRDGFDGFDGFGHKDHFDLDAIAGELELSVDELRESLAGGSTLAEIAEEQGIATDTLIDTALDGLDEKLDALVADGRLTQERADQIRQGSAAMLEAMINGEMPGVRGFRFPHGEGFHGRQMPGPGGFFGHRDEIKGENTAA